MADLRLFTAKPSRSAATPRFSGNAENSSGLRLAKVLRRRLRRRPHDRGHCPGLTIVR